MNPSVVIAAATAALVIGLTGLDVVVEPRSDEAAEVRPIPAQTAGTWYCAAGDTAAGTTLELTGTAVAARRSGSWMRIETFADGVTATLGEEDRVVRGQVRSWVPEAGVADTGAVASWRDGAALLARTWTREVLGEPAGLVHGPCETEPSTTWIAPGMTTLGGSVARLVVANPFDTDAAIGVDLLGPSGAESPELLKNIGVPARTVRTIVLNDHAPERDHVAAVVTVRAGRVVAEGWQSVDPAVGDVAGVSLVKLARSPAERWTVPWLPAGSGESWLWIANPGGTQAELSVSAHAGPDVPLTAAPVDVSVPATSAATIPVADLLPEGATSGGFTVVSENGVAVAVGAGTRSRSADVARTGFAVQLAQPDLSRFWAIPGVSGEGRGSVLHLLNPTSRVAEVEVRIATDVGLLTPSELGSIAVPAGAALGVDLAPFVAELGAHTVIVEATRGAVAASSHSFRRQGALHLAIHHGVTNEVWAPVGVLGAVERDPSLARRIGTSLGPATETAEEQPVIEESPTPAGG